jgi:hypothetical protein
MPLKASTLLLWGAIGLAAYYLYQQGAALANLNFLPNGIGFNGSGFQASLLVQNTSSSSVQLNSFSGYLVVNGYNVGNISDFTAATILPNAQTQLQFNMVPNLVGAAGALISQMSSSEFAINSASIQGTANVGGQQVPVTVTLQ